MNFVNLTELTEDSKKLARMIPKQYSGVITIPRSGLIPATVVSLHHNIPLMTVDMFLASESFGEGRRCLSGVERDSYILIDDSIFGGVSMAEAKKKLGDRKNIDSAAVYISDVAPDIADFYVRLVKKPRIFEWNLFHHRTLYKTCCDIDGVLCPDPTLEENDDGEKYIDFIKNTRPLVVPTNPINTLVTCRLEKYRGLTNEWLNRHGIEYSRLVMMQYKTAKERRAAGGYGAYKAEIYKKSKDCGFFIESDIKQARQIREISKKPVLCTDGMVLV